jgi:uncharacterized protein YceK
MKKLLVTFLLLSLCAGCGTRVVTHVPAGAGGAAANAAADHAGGCCGHCADTAGLAETRGSCCQDGPPPAAAANGAHGNH